MASSKELQQTSRPLAHRPSITAIPASGGFAVRQSHSRNNSHSVLSSSLNANHRISRRKSMTNTAANMAAVAAAFHGADDKATALPIASGARRNTMSKSGMPRAAAMGSLPSPPASLPTHKFVSQDGKTGVHDSAIDDDLNDISGDEGPAVFQKARIRRASDGQPLAKDGKKSNRVELRCDKCGKGYKHSSCLTKHLWEHTPEWSYTSKLLISKHQQVQLLEAASVLVSMNVKDDNIVTPPDSARDFTSEDSASPAASGASSDLADGRSSADTTPPPQSDAMHNTNMSYRTLSKRYSSGSGFSRSYQSAPSNAPFTASVPNSSAFSYYRQQNLDHRPPSSGMNITGQEDRELAAAVELLSCSFGSNGGSRTVHLPPDAPPVPPLPAQYLEQAALTGTSFINSFPNRAPESFTRGERLRDIKMEDSGESVMDDEDDDTRSRARSDEDDDGVFGRMEE
ncbi:Tat pathway signal sequence [Pleurostoma richardsiae]|uniref:Tat pathway signal sequence n=1 Tax=Pleurostoma richardsiae TaxID=41990 RepID=A0AA38S2J0_9PEZI|nr:Tat pathway signal sequence [Pleurostoma richardsiae]